MPFDWKLILVSDQLFLYKSRPKFPSIFTAKEQSFANKVKKGKGKGRIKVKEMDNRKQTTVKIDQVDGNNNDDKSAAMSNVKAKKSGFEIPRRRRFSRKSRNKGNREVAKKIEI